MGLPKKQNLVRNFCKQRTGGTRRTAKASEMIVVRLFFSGNRRAAPVYAQLGVACAKVRQVIR